MFLCGLWVGGCFELLLVANAVFAVCVWSVSLVWLLLFVCLLLVGLDFVVFIVCLIVVLIVLFS